MKSVSCPTGRPESAVVAVAARPGIVDLWIAEVDPGEMNRFSSTSPISPAKLLRTSQISATGQSHVRMGNTSDTSLAFNSKDIEGRTIKSVQTKSYVKSLTRSLLGE